MRSVKVTLPSSTGTTMVGSIDFPDSPPKAFAIFAHCFAGSHHTPGAARTCKQLTDFGIASLRFDFPGLGQSEGEFADTTFSQNVADLKAAANWLAEYHSAPQLIMGHSLGGAAALAAASQIDSIAAVATIGAPFDPAHSVLHYADKIDDIDQNGYATVTLGGRDLVISKSFLEDLADTNPEVYLSKLRKPLLLLHSPIDQTVGINNAQTIFSATRYPKSLVSLEKTDHLLTRQGTAQRAANLIGAWSDQFIEPENVPEPAAPNEAISHQAVGTKFGVVVRHNSRSVTADRSKARGGRGQGFSAYGLLMSSLATSTTQAARAKVRDLSKDAQVDDIRVHITQLDDNTFERRISFIGKLTDEDRAKLWAAAKTGAVQSLITGANIIDVLDEVEDSK